MKAGKAVFVAPEKQAAIHELRAQMLSDKEALDRQVSKGEIDAVEFAHKVNTLAAKFLRRASKVLNRDEFSKAFGSPYSPETPIVVDPEIAACYSRRK